ncbi:MAG: DUF819 family protein [Clostridia bacterium]|nr:DUF819 family protein [Clostridia bacterium]
MTSFISSENTWVLFSILVIIAGLAVWMEQRFTWAAKVSGCVLALIMAMILANLRIIPTDAPAYDFVWSYVVPLAIPMLLFQANVKKIWKESGRVLAIYIISGIGTVVGAFAGFYILRNQIPDLYKIAAMMTGSYTGGSVNLVAMSDAFGVTGDVVSASVVADNLLMALYFFALVAIPSIKFFVTQFSHPYEDALKARRAAGESENNAATYWTAKPVSLLDIAKTMAISFAIVAVSVETAGFFADVIPADNFFLALLNGLFGNKYLIITTLTVLLATLLPGKIGTIAGAQEIGTFLIHIFFAVIGVPASIYLIVTQAPLLLVFCLIVVALNMLFSFVFGWIFKFSLEEICVASNANIGGPTTAAAFAIAKGWTAMVVPSLLVGTLGYVVGNYYGIFIGTFLGR